LYQDKLEQTQKASMAGLEWINNNKIKTTGLSIFAIYSLIFYRIYQNDKINKNSESWIYWKKSQSLEDLLQEPADKLASDLLESIQAKYVHPTHPTDFIYSIVQASSAFDKEINCIQRQIAIYKYLESLRCLQLFFIKLEDKAMLEEQHRRLLYIKNIFSSWCARYKIEKNY